MGPSGLAVTLHMLRDVPGVRGSLLWAQDTSLVASDLVPARSEAVVQAVANRLQRLVEAHASAGALMEGLTLRYETYCVHVCGVANASLAVLMVNARQLPALKLALGQVLRELSCAPELLALGLPSQPVVDTRPREAKSVSAPSADAGHTVRLYRGRSLG